MRHREPIIVIVDPDAERATTLSLELDRKGYHVFRRSSGIDALECVAENHPELVLSEMELLDLESPELLRSIREASPATRVLFVQHQAASFLSGERLVAQVDAALSPATP
jgi:two-component system response regulator GlrR